MCPDHFYPVDQRPTELPTNEGDFAIIVGIDNYPGIERDAGHGPLKGAVRDAHDFAEWVMNRRIGGAVPARNCHVILSNENPGQPIQDEVDLAWQHVVETLDEGYGRRLYLYFSGHGLAPDFDAADFCMANWSEIMRSAALNSRAYCSAISAYGKFSELICILDCCRVRKVNARGRGPGFEPPTPSVHPNGTTHWFIGFATQFNYPAYEAAIGDEVPRGHFTRALMAGLRGAAASPGGGVTPAGLKDYLDLEVPRIASRWNHRQKPCITSDFPSASQTTLGSARRFQEVEITFSKNRIGPVALHDMDLECLRRDVINGAPWNFVLEFGQYLITDEGSGQMLDLKIDPPEGGEEKIHVKF